MPVAFNARPSKGRFDTSCKFQFVHCGLTDAGTARSVIRVPRVETVGAVSLLGAVCIQRL